MSSASEICARGEKKDMTAKKTKNALVYVWISTLVTLLDQLTKYLVSHHLDVDQSIRALPFLNITLRFNAGAAFSFLSRMGGWQVYLLGGIAIVVSIGLMIWLSRLHRKDWITAIPLCLILGGAVGNLIDRIRFGYVIDFVDFHIHTWHFATFNLADAAVSVGAVLLIVGLLFHKGLK